MTAAGIDDVLAVARRHAARTDHEGRFPLEGLQALRSSGLMGMFVPTEHGGLGGDVHVYAATARALAGECMSLASIWVMHAFQVDALVRFGDEELRRDLLPRLAAGKTYVASVTTEPGSGADLFTSEAPLHVNGDLASFERRAPVVTGARHADGFLISLRSSADAEPTDVTLVYADRDQLIITENGGWDTLGVRGTESLGLELAGTVPLRNLVGGAGGFGEVARESMIPLAHVGWSASWLGAAQASFSKLLTWLRDPKRRGGPDVRSELVRERLARIRVDLDMVSAYLAKVCDLVAEAQRDGGSLAMPRAQLHLNGLKLAASELTFKAANDMVQLAGLSGGYSRSAPIPFERTFRDLRSGPLNYSNNRLWPATGALALLDREVALL
jgi:acyl-CoA dehydrogenase